MLKKPFIVFHGESAGADDADSDINYPEALKG